MGTLLCACGTFPAARTRAQPGLGTGSCRWHLDPGNLNSFPGATKVVAQNSRDFIFFSSGDWESEISQGVGFLEALEENSCPWFSHLLGATSIPWLLGSCCFQNASPQPLVLHHVAFSSDSNSLYAPLIRRHVATRGPLGMRSHLVISLNFITSAEPLVPRSQSQVLGLRTGTSLGLGNWGHYSAYC